MKTFFVFILLYLIHFPLQAQQLKFNPPDNLLHALCNIKSSPGISEDYYYVLYNDYGARLDFNNSIDSYLKIYSVKRGTLIRSVHLNPLVSAAVKSKRIIINDVIRWKGHILGLYTTKNPGGNELVINAQLFEEKGKKLGKSVILGVFPFEFPQSIYTGQGGLLINARGILSIADQLHYTFNKDSSQIAFYTVAKEGRKYLGFTIVDSDLKLLKKVSCKNPFKKKGARFAQLKLDENNLYLLVCDNRRKPGAESLVTIKKKYVVHYILLAIDINNGMVKETPLSLPGKAILDATFSLDKDGNILLTGSYYNKDKRGNHYSTNGYFAIKVDAETKKIIHTDARDFPDEMVKELESKKAASKGKGLDEFIEMNNMINLPKGETIVFGQSHDKKVKVSGRTGALNIHYDEYGNIAFSEITPEGKIKWSAYVKRHARILEGNTNTAPVCAFTVKNNIVVIYNAESKHKRGVYFDIYNNEGKVKSIFTALPKKYDKGTDILWSTAQRINSNEIIATYYKAKKKEMGTVKIMLPSL